MEDKKLFDYAKLKLPELAEGDEPFAMTLLTVDTHHVAGYVCEECDDKYEEQYENVYACSSRQVASFVKWLKKQDFYKDTTVIICGDHFTMDAEYIGRNVVEGYPQHVYNCILNPQVEENAENYKNREFCGMDMFPTTLAAMGCTIEGNRLGLGTNLFSNKPTLLEQMGYEEFDRQIGMNSNYYLMNFVLGEKEGK